MLTLMSRYFRITINREVLAAHLAREHRRSLTDTEIDQWLIDAGFRKADNQWIVREEDLGHLDPSEVTQADEIELP